MLLLLSVCASRLLYAHDCTWLLSQLTVGDCWITPDGSQVFNCHKNPAEDYFCSATSASFPGNGTYMDANVRCLFPGYREDTCEYHVILLSDSSTDWRDGNSATCTDTCSPEDDHTGSDVVVVAIGATIGGRAVIGVIVFIVHRIRRDVASESSTPPLGRGLAAEDGIAQAAAEEEAPAKHGHHKHHKHHKKDSYKS
jgi:hypothetical protein